jgi:hypothetical protein
VPLRGWLSARGLTPEDLQLTELVLPVPVPAAHRTPAGAPAPRRGGDGGTPPGYYVLLRSGAEQQLLRELRSAGFAV